MDIKVLVWAACLLPIAVAVESDDSCDDDRLALLSNLTTGYDKKRRPNSTGAPVDVDIQIYLTSFTEINEKEQKLGMAGYFRVWWVDPRLAYLSTSDGGCFDSLTLHEAERTLVWQPDLYFDNLLEVTPSSADLFVVYPSGQIWHSQRLNHMYECRMNFKKLPFDEQTCTIKIASYSLDATKVRVAPRAPGLTLPSERAEATVVWDIAHVLSSTTIVEDGTGRPWAWAELQLVLRRQPDFWIRGTVMKALLFVVISWCGFFVNRAMAPARVSIGVIPVLIMINLINGAEGHLPPLSYSTTLTDYLMTCLIFTSMAVFEYALVAYLLQREVWYAEKFRVLLQIGGSYLKKEQSFTESIPEEGPATVGREVRDLIDEGTLEEEPPSAEEKRETPRGPKMDSNLKKDGTSSADATTDGPATPRSAGEGDLERASRSKKKMLSWQRPKAALHKAPSRIFDAHPVIDAIFKEFDRERNGKYSVHEMRAALRGFGQYRSHREVREMFSMVGVAHGEDMTLLQFEQFLADPELYLPVTSTKRNFWDMPPSLQVDVFMRWAYPGVWACISLIHALTVLM